jgi:acyl-CoA synthetase (AMP-forming)/AMP-acid ligase II
MSGDLVERLDVIFALDPAAAAIEQNGRSYSYAAVRRFMRQLDELFAQARIPTGAPIALLLRNDPVSLAAAIAIIMTRRCLVTVNPLLPGRVLQADLSSLSVSAIVAEATNWETPLLADAARDAGCAGIQLSEAGSELEATTVIPATHGSPLRTLLPGIAVEMLTSGTTGPPKRIKLELESLSRSLWAGSKYEDTDGTPRLKKSPSLVWMPLAHIGGLWNALYQVYSGRRVLLLERFNIDQWRAAIREHRLRFVSLPPSALREVLERGFPREDFASLKAIRCGTAPLDHALAAQFEHDYGVPVLEAYGATEFAGGVAGWTIQDHRQYSKTRRTSVGRANPGVELRIVDQTTFEPVEIGSEGLLEVRTRQIDDGRFWIRTTDRARLDAEGFLYILGRADSVINRGGFKIVPEDVETAMRLHPAVAEACVVGLPDERLGKVPVAAYELKASAESLTAAELKSFLAGHLKPYEIPTQFLRVAQLPRTHSLKISQLRVRELFAERTAV